MIGFTPTGSVVGTHEKASPDSAVGGLYKHRPRVQKHLVLAVQRALYQLVYKLDGHVVWMPRCRISCHNASTK